MKAQKVYAKKLKKAFFEYQKNDEKNKNTNIPHWESRESEKYIDMNQPDYEEFRYIYKNKLSEKVDFLRENEDLTYSESISDVDMNSDYEPHNYIMKNKIFDLKKEKEKIARKELGHRLW